MEQKRLLQLLGILAVLLLLAWISGFFEGAPSTVDTPEIALNVDDVESIEIRKGDDLVQLVRSGGNWALSEPVEAEIDTATKSTFLNSVDGMSIESLISSRADGYDRYQVDSAQATYIRFGKTDGESLELYVGKSGPDFQSKYVRLGGDDRVFLAIGVPTAQPNVDRWRNKVLWTYPPGGISKVDVTTPESDYALVASESGWMIEDASSSIPADSAKVARYLTRLSNLRVDGFLLDESMESVVDSASHSIDVTGIDGSSRRLQMWTRASDAAAISSATDAVLKLNSYRVKSFAPESSEFKPD